MENLTLSELRQKLKEEETKFRLGARTWVGVCTFLFLLNAVTNPGEWWAIYPFLGWGLGIFLSANKLRELRREVADQSHAYEKPDLSLEEASKQPTDEKLELESLPRSLPEVAPPTLWNKKDFV